MARQQFEIKQPSVFDIIIGILTLGLIIFGLFYIAKLGIQLLTWIAPLLFVATLIINYKVVVNYFYWLKSLFQTKVLWGIGATLLTIIFHPIVALGLFFRAFFGWRLRKTMKQFKDQQEQAQYQESVQPQIGEYVAYEEVEKEPIEITKKRKSKEKQNNYDQFFE